MLQKGEVQVVFPLKGEFISTVFLVKKERWGPAMNLKQLNSFALYQHFKNGETKLAKALNPKGRLDDKTRQEKMLTLLCQ